MKPHTFSLMLVGILLVTTPLHAYWSEAHKKLAEAANNGNVKSSAKDGSEPITDYYSQRLGFPHNKKYTVDDIERVNPLPFLTTKTNGALTKTVKYVHKEGTDIMFEGADDEGCPFIRAINHFSDPAHNNSLGESIWLRKEFLYQFDDSITGFATLVNYANKTPDWALEDNATIPGYLRTDPVSGVTSIESRQNYSLRDSYDYLYQAHTAHSTTTNCGIINTLAKSEQYHA